MSNPAVITLENASSRKGKFKRFVIEDNIGESVHLHMDNMRVDFSINEFLEFSSMVRMSLRQLKILDGYSFDKFDEHFLKECAELLPKLKKIEIKKKKISGLKCLVHSNYNSDLNLIKSVSVEKTPAYKYLQGDKSVFEAYDQFNYFGINNEDRLLKTLYSIEENNYPYDDRYVIIFNNQNIIRDGQHRAAVLAHKYGVEHEIEVMEFCFEGKKHKMNICKENFMTIAKWFLNKVYQKIQ